MMGQVPVRDSAGRIVTARLRLRQWVEEDRAPFGAMTRDPRVMTYFPALLMQFESDALINRQHQAIFNTGIGFWAIERLADNKFIGFTGIQPVMVSSPVHGEIEIGWRLARAYWGVGYAEEAARAALWVAFVERELASVVAMTVPDNSRSRRVMERIGMERRPELDFGHPDLPELHRLHRHIVYGIDNPAAVD